MLLLGLIIAIIAVVSYAIVTQWRNTSGTVPMRVWYSVAMAGTLAGGYFVHWLHTDFVHWLTTVTAP
jgi:hypothetical protein